MGKTLATILALLAIGFGSGCTPEGRSLIGSLFMHGAREKISHELNPHETNVNVYNQQQNQTNSRDKYMRSSERVGNWIPLPHSYTFLGIKDKNKDGYIGGDELIGLGSYFECKTMDKTIRIGCGSSWDYVKGKKATCKLKETKTGKIIGVKDNPTFTRRSGSVGRWLHFRKTKDDEGIISYTIEWYINGRKIPTRTIEFFVDYGEKEVSEKPENKEK